MLLPRKSYKVDVGTDPMDSDSLVCEGTTAVVGSVIVDASSVGDHQLAGTGEHITIRRLVSQTCVTVSE